MYTRCPECQAWFHVTAAQLRAARGQARCGQCATRFDALRNLTDQLPDLPDRELPGGRIHEYIPPPPKKPVKKGPQQNLALEASVELPARFQPGDWAGRSTPDSSRRTLLWGLGSLVAAALLAGQWLNWSLPHWAADPGQRDRAEQICAALPTFWPGSCRLPPLIDYDQLVLRNHQLTSAPDNDAALHFSGILVNQAGFSQPYPLLHISMQNHRGEAVAVGDFGPADYLAAPLADDQRLGPGERVPVSLTMQDPGGRASGFRFDFRPLSRNR